MMAGWDAATGLLPLLLAYARIQACVLAMPGFGEAFLTARVKVGLAAALTPMFAVPVAATMPDAGALALLVGAELLTGLLLGIAVRLLALSLDIAATALAQSASLAQIMGISPDMPPHPIGNLVHLAGLAVLMAMGLPVLLCRLLADSFALRGLGGAWPRAEEAWRAIPPLVADSFALAMLLAAPFILGGFLFQALSGVVARVMPALPVVFLAAPAAILLALVALALLTPGILALWADHVLSAGPGTP
ncbi:MAG TPA: flagellar biosynthetic protein FliR [Paracoccus sp. (in: a-proteobacteria)]|nr:flagellar biosynthetic protein FliR [Paracoccus sp. (in: a-proteobacteria)]